MPVDVKEVKRRLQILLNDENLVAEYIRRFGPVIDIKHIKLIKENDQATESSSADGIGQMGDDPIFEVKIICPVCGHDKIISHELKAKAQQIQENRLLQQEYIGALGHKTVDYDFLAVSVCPRCLFASPDRKDFSGINKITGKTTISQIQPNVILKLQELIGERKALLDGISDPEAFFKRPRKSEAAIMSYRLASLRAKVEAYFELPNSLYKLGFYHIKIAKIMKKRHEDDAPALREAMDYLVECFKNSDASGEVAEYRVLYCIVAILIRLGEAKKAHPYVAVFDKIRTELNAKSKTDPKVSLTFIDSWLNKTKVLWEDRERDDLFK